MYKLFVRTFFNLVLSSQNLGKEQEEREDLLNASIDHQLCISCQYASLDISVHWIHMTSFAPVVSITMDLTA